jgi:hypothetical protein
MQLGRYPPADHHMSPSSQHASRSISEPSWSAALNREFGRIDFVAAGPDAEAALAVSLCKYLVARGVPCGVADDPLSTTAVQLRRVPDLDAVDRLVAEWVGAARVRPPDPPTCW